MMFCPGCSPLTKLGSVTTRTPWTYSIAKGELFNMVLTHPEANSPETWDQSNALAEMKAVYTGWDPTY